MIALEKHQSPKVLLCLFPMFQCLKMPLPSPFNMSSKSLFTEHYDEAKIEQQQSSLSFRNGPSHP